MTGNTLLRTTANLHSRDSLLQSEQVVGQHTFPSWLDRCWRPPTGWPLRDTWHAEVTVEVSTQLESPADGHGLVIQGVRGRRAVQKLDFHHGVPLG